MYKDKIVYFNDNWACFRRQRPTWTDLRFEAKANNQQPPLVPSFQSYSHCPEYKPQSCLGEGNSFSRREECYSSPSVWNSHRRHLNILPRTEQERRVATNHQSTTTQPIIEDRNPKPTRRAARRLHGLTCLEFPSQTLWRQPAGRTHPPSRLATWRTWCKQRASWAETSSGRSADQQPIRPTRLLTTR